MNGERRRGSSDEASTGEEPERATTALIIGVELPPAIEALRIRADPWAAAGCPAHVTLLYPFAGEPLLGAAVLGRIARLCEEHDPFAFELGRVSSWPDTIYLQAEPAERFRPLQSALADAFPDYPLYGGGLPFVPHVTIAAGSDAEMLRAAEAEAREASAQLLPIGTVARRVELIAQDGTGEWRVLEDFPLGRSVEG